MTKPVQSETRDVTGANAALPGLFVFAAASALAVAFLKLGTPSVMEDRISAPKSLGEIIFSSWPALVGQLATGGAVVLGWLALLGDGALGERGRAPRWILLAPAIWLAWQFVASLDTVSGRLTVPTLLHFTVTTIWFYLGVLVLGRVRRLGGFRLVVLAGFSLMVLVGLEQHFWGLEDTRKFFYARPELIAAAPPDFQAKLASDRIWGTLFYPNAFAGGILLLLPVSLAFLWKLTAGRFEPSARWVLVGLVVIPALSCLYWTGSKTGLLLALGQGVAFLAFLPIPRKVKVNAGVAILAVGLAGFFWLFADYFKGGARSLGARADYWRAAATTFSRNPLNGSGPGTFMVPYQQLKSEDSEMARLAHNDYLQQASDSGFIGFAAFMAFIWGSVILLGRKGVRSGDWEFRLIWLGLTGWALQIGMEFSLYIPGLAWPAFLLFGLLWGLPDKANPVDKPHDQN